MENKNHVLPFDGTWFLYVIDQQRIALHGLIFGFGFCVANDSDREFVEGVERKEYD